MRKTLSSVAVVSGIGLHTGVPATMTFKPAENGITFLRTDIPGAKPIAALAQNVGSTLRGTNLKNDTAEVCTVEHALSALHALGVTDVAVEMDGPEPPVTDGASDVYIDALQKAGLRELASEQPVLNIKNKINQRQHFLLGRTRRQADVYLFIFTQTPARQPAGIYAGIYAGKLYPGNFPRAHLWV